MNQPIRILQITDLHLFGDTQTKLIGFNTYQSFKQLITKVSADIAKKPPDLIALTGDVSQDYSLESYQAAAKFLSTLPCPVMATVGNHDDPLVFVKIFPNLTDYTNKLFTKNNWRVLFLNSHWPEHIAGQLSKKELDFLHETLTTASKQHFIIFIHHPVLPVGSNWLDKIILNNATQLLEIIDQHQNIKAVICGHVHQETKTTRLGVDYLSTPSTCWQFTVASHDFKLDTLMPGYRWIELYEDGTFQTEVVRIDYDDAFIPDLKSKGY